MEHFDISPETQRTMINLMLAALRRLNNPAHGGFAEVDDFDISPEIQRQFINTVQAFAAGIKQGVTGAPPPQR